LMGARAGFQSVRTQSIEFACSKLAREQQY
jgi:hypothetical protein